MVLRSIVLLNFCLVVSLIGQRKWSKTSSISVYLYTDISSFSFISFRFTYFATLLFGTYRFRIAMSSWKIIIVIIIYSLSVSLAIFFDLNPTLTHIAISTFVVVVVNCFLAYLSPFYFSLPILLNLKWACYRQHTVGSIFSNLMSVNWWF